MELTERYADKIIPVPESGCWLWTGAIMHKGYGLLVFKGKTSRAHRVFYEEYVGPISKGQHVLHKCDTRNCVNPAHLFLGTNLDNIEDMVSKGRRKVGEQVHSSKLTEEQVREIMLAEGKQRDIATQYGINQALVWRIKHGKTWKHITAR